MWFYGKIIVLVLKKRISINDLIIPTTTNLTLCIYKKEDFFSKFFLNPFTAINRKQLKMVVWMVDFLSDLLKFYRRSVLSVDRSCYDSSLFICCICQVLVELTEASHANSPTLNYLTGCTVNSRKPRPCIFAPVQLKEVGVFEHYK